jgi:hypothetical protein
MWKVMRDVGIRRSLAAVFLSVALVISQVGIVTAVDYKFAEPEETSNREKAHLNINFTGGGNGETAECTDPGAILAGNDNREKAFRYFVGKGFSEKQAAGIVGNFVVESAVNPKRVQGAGVIESETLPASGGYGIAQWDDRKSLLKKFSEEIDPAKRPIYDLGLQLDFVMWELNGPEKAAYEAFKPTSTISEATTVWMDRYERPGDLKLAKRIAAANKAYGDFASGAGNPSSAPPTPTDTASCGGSGSIVAIAQAELAKRVLEDPIGCDAGNPSTPGDCGKEVNKYTDSTLEYWCADFVSWVYKQAGTPFKGGSSGGWRIASVEGVQAYMERSGTFHTNGQDSPDPKPGDVYVINNGEHIGIVVKVEGNKLYAISGNTSTENYANGVGVGDTVYTNYKNDGSITGYGGLR